MTGPKPRVRFAPSPTGELHIGNARTALFNWLFARHHGGNFILRIEDTDRLRTSETFEKNILADLKWLGLDWDEGPEKDGGFGPYRQSERADLYETYLNQLRKAGMAYPCYCSEEELEAERACLIARSMPPRYGGKCRDLTDEERRRKERECGPPAYRFRVGQGSAEFTDLIRGPMKFECDALGDFIIMRSDGTPAYNFAVVVDDHHMMITHVIRGEDHLSNTASQILLYQALGFDLPVFAHHSLITGKDRAKLSKRHGSVAVREFRERGFLPEAVVNYLSILGSSFAEGQEILPVDRIVREFSLEKTGKGSAVFDEDKLKWVNSTYIRNYDPEKLTDVLAPFIRAAGYDLEGLDRGWLRSVVAAVQGNMTLLADIGDYLALFHDDRYRVSDEAATLLKDGRAREIVRLFSDALASNDLQAGDFYTIAVKEVRKESGAKGRELYMPLRAAITGSTAGPELDKIAAILGREAILKRLESVLKESGA